MVANFPEMRATTAGAALGCAPQREPGGTDAEPLDPDPVDPSSLEPPTDDPMDELDELELDDPVIDEAALPELDVEDAETPVRDSTHDDLLDRGWLERAAEDDKDDERSVDEEIGLTIDLDGPLEDDDSAQVVDLDVGSLLTSLPSDGTELELDIDPREGRADTGLGSLHGSLQDVLLPEDVDAEHDDREVGDDERFPVFDPDDRAPRPGGDDESEIGPDELS